MKLPSVGHSLVALSCLAAIMQTGCKFGDEPIVFGVSQNVWVANEMVQLTEQTPPSNDLLIFDSTSETVNLSAAAGQTIGFQIIVDADRTPPNGRTLEFTPLTGKQSAIDVKSLKAYRMYPVAITRYPPWRLRMSDKPVEPASYYDMLKELAGVGVFGIPSERRAAIWIDLAIPQDAPAGMYQGKITAKLGGQKWQANLSVRIYDLVIPESARLPVVAGFDHWTILKEFFGEQALLRGKDADSRKATSLLREFIAVAHEHGIDAVPLNLRPTATFGKNGDAVQYDWSSYDIFASPYITGRAFTSLTGSSLWPAPFDQSWPDINQFNDLDGKMMERYDSAVQKLLLESQTHLKAAIDERRAFVWPYRGRIDAQAYKRHVALAGMARSACPGAFILTHLPPNLPTMAGWENPPEFARLADIIAPPAQWMDPTTIDGVNQFAKAPAGIWLSPGQPPFLPNLGLISSPPDARVIPWFAEKYHCRGLFIPDIINPSEDESPEKSNSLIHFVSASDKGIMPSIRLKRLRRGLQDVACLRLLERHGRRPTATAMLDAIARYACMAAAGNGYFDPRLDGWVTDIRAWDVATMLTMEELSAAIHPDDTAAKASVLRRQTEWRRLYDAACSIKIEQTRARIVPLEQDGRVSLSASIEVDIYNEFDRDMDCVVKFAQLPDQWTASQPMDTAGGFKSGTRQMLKLAAESRQMLCSDHDGKIIFPIRLVSGYLNEQSQVEAAFIVVPKTDTTQRGATIDWTKNGIASGFVTAGRPGTIANRRASCQTVVTVRHDAANVRISARCMEPNPSGMVVRNDNIVRYEQLMACQEDLFEVLLDPGLTASGPDDLYHIVVKPNGAVISQRGMPSNQSVARCIPWASGAEASVTKDQNCWTIELTIPKVAFGRPGQSTAWGVNFARYNWQKQESSSWAGPARYYYHPKNLGTMYLVPG